MRSPSCLLVDLDINRSVRLYPVSQRRPHRGGCCGLRALPSAVFIDFVINNLLNTNRKQLSVDAHTEAFT